MRGDLCSLQAANIDWNHTGLWNCSCRAAPADQHLYQSAQEHLQAHLKNRTIYLPELRKQGFNYWSTTNTNPTYSCCSPPPVYAWPLQPHLPSTAQPVLWPELNPVFSCPSLRITHSTSLSTKALLFHHITFGFQSSICNPEQKNTVHYF